MDWTLEVVILPVSDIEASIAFYRDKVGFDLDHDTTNEHMHVAQLTPRGSGCSIVLGDLPGPPRDDPGLDPRPPVVRRRCGDRPPGADGSRRRVQRDHRVRSARRRHVLRLQRPRRQHLGRPAAQGPRREAADPATSTAPASAKASSSDAIARHGPMADLPVRPRDHRSVPDDRRRRRSTPSGSRTDRRRTTSSRRSAPSRRRSSPGSATRRSPRCRASPRGGAPSAPSASTRPPTARRPRRSSGG